MRSFLFKSRNPIRESLGQLAVVASIIVAILYPFNVLPFDPILVKGSAVGFLAVYALFRVASFDHILLVIALFVGALGDMQLELQVPDAFVTGLKNFLIGHIFYIIIFLRNRIPAFEISRSRMNSASFVWVVAAVAAIWIYPAVVEGKFHIAAYAVGIIGMASAALISRYPIKLVGLGAVLFIVSDGIIGAEIIYNTPEWISYLIWPLYYLAQLLITAGILLTPLKKRSRSLR